MADIFTIEDTLYDIYRSILPPEYPLIWSDQEMPEFEETYVTIEVENLQQLGSPYYYPSIPHPTIPDKILARSKVELETPLVFTALGVDAKKALYHILLSRASETHRNTLKSSGVGVRGNGSGVQSVPQVVGTANEIGATLIVDIGIAHITEYVHDYIETTEVTGTLLNPSPDFPDVPYTDYYFEEYGYTVDTVIKDYHTYDGKHIHKINLGKYNEPITKINNAGTYL